MRVTERLQIPESEFDFKYVRSSGPGGQNVNKVATQAQLRWDVVNSPSLPDDIRERFLKRWSNRIVGDGELLICSQRYRQQKRNVDDCLERLRVMLLEVALPPRRRKPTRPTRGSVERRLQEKRARSQKKQRRSEPGPEA